MKGGVPVAPQQQRDRVVTAGMMLVRAGFVAAGVLGVGMSAHLWSAGQVIMFHMPLGVLTLLGMLVVVIRALTQGKPAVLMAIAGIVLGIGGAAIALTEAAPGLVHLVLMVLAVGLAEMNARQLKKV